MGCGASKAAAKYMRPGVDTGKGLGLEGKDFDVVKKKLRATDLLEHVSDKELGATIKEAVGDVWTLKDKCTVMEEGESPAAQEDHEVAHEAIDGMFLLIEGGLEAWKREESGEERRVWEFRKGKEGDGDWFGEGSFLGEARRAASVRTVGVTKVIHISRPAWERLKSDKALKKLWRQRVKFLTEEFRLLVAAKRSKEKETVKEKLTTAVKVGNKVYSLCQQHKLPMPNLEPIPGLNKPRCAPRANTCIRCGAGLTIPPLSCGSAFPSGIRRFRNSV